MSVRLTGQESIRHIPGGQEATILEFWQWAFSDIKQNDVRGVFSEWLVARILGLELLPCRESWGAYDLITPTGTKLEIKSAAYLQSWHGDSGALSKIVFSGLKGRTWDVKTGFSAEPTYNADVYVFCLQTCCEPAKWNALNINQWRFYYLKRASLETLNIRSISLKRLSQLVEPLTADGLYLSFLTEGWIIPYTDNTHKLFDIESRP